MTTFLMWDCCVNAQLSNLNLFCSKGVYRGMSFLEFVCVSSSSDHYTKFTKTIRIIGEVFQIKVSDALQRPCRKRQYEADYPKKVET